MQGSAKLKIVTIVGARPQFIKAAVVSREVRARGAKEVLVHTGQHYDANMSDVFFSELEIPPPDVHLEVGSGSHGAQTGRMLEAIECVLKTENPDWVLIYGDTNSTLAGALAAVKLHLPVAHVEAGLRSFNRSMPEEINRIVADAVADLLLVPTTQSLINLRLEGVADAKMHDVGDVMFDAALFYGCKAAKESVVLKSLGLEKGQYILATVHRAENTDDPARLCVIFDAFASIASDVPVVIPMHPRTRLALNRIGKNIGPHIQVINPIGYLDMVMLEQNARLIATDSGGVQKEAFFYRVPCITLRDETEWVELVQLGWNTIAPPRNVDEVCRKIRASLSSKSAEAASPYGDGHAAVKIVDLLLNFHRVSSAA